MLEQYSISIEQLLEHYNVEAEFNADNLLIFQIKSNSNFMLFPCRIDAFIIGVCQKGELNLTVNFNKLVVKENSCFLSIPENLIEIGKVEDDFKGYAIVISKDYIKDIHLDIDLSSYYMLIRSNPCFPSEEKNIVELTSFYEILAVEARNENSRWKNEIIKGAVSILVYKALEIIEQYKQNTEKPQKKGKEYYFLKFLRLCSESYHEHHNVSYYADKMSLTPKYLSAIVKEVSGLSAVEWIKEYVIKEAKFQLKFSDKTIQEISNSLNFSNQYFFGRYFKKHVGISPKYYRAKDTPPDA